MVNSEKKGPSVPLAGSNAAAALLIFLIHQCIFWQMSPVVSADVQCAGIQEFDASEANFVEGDLCFLKNKN